MKVNTNRQNPRQRQSYISLVMPVLLIFLLLIPNITFWEVTHGRSSLPSSADIINLCADSARIQTSDHAKETADDVAPVHAEQLPTFGML